MEPIKTLTPCPTCQMGGLALDDKGSPLVETERTDDAVRYHVSLCRTCGGTGLVSVFVNRGN